MPSHRLPFPLPLRLLITLTALVCGLQIAAPAAGAEAADDLLTPWQVITTRSVSSAALGPEGHIAYTLSVPRRPIEDESGSSWRELHVVTPAGASRPFVSGEVNVAGVSFLPSGEIGFLAKRGDDEHTSLYAIPVDGGEARPLLRHAESIRSWDLAADGTVAFLALEEKAKEAEKLEKKGFNQEIYEEDDRFTRLFLADSTDGPEAEATQIELEGSLRSVAFSGDGQRLVVTTTPTPVIDDSYVAQSLHVIDRSGKVLRSLSPERKIGTMRLDRDGSKVALIAAADPNDPAAGRLMRWDASAGLVDLLPDFEGHISDLRWKDDDTIVYLADRGTQTEVGTVPFAGGAASTVLAPQSTILTSLGDGLPGQKLAAIGNAPQHPGELFSLDLATGELKRLTDSNPWLDNVRLARQESITYEARDGLELEGILIYPLDYEAGKRYPLVMVVHGGPESHYRNGWLTGYSQFGQLAAQRGFAVFYPNYRGSTGRGVEFSKISQADAAGPEFDDLVDGVDHLIERGLVDRDRVGITGGSYGGYASAWATTYYSERFAAAIPFVGISDNISKVGTTDIPVEMYAVHHRKWLWDDWDYFAERSPIYYVQRNRTPTLILHGKSDPRVHPSQSLELHRHLKVLGQAPVRLVLYPGEGHGNSKSAARFDYMLRTLRWMEHYLQGPGGDPPPYAIDYESYLPEELRDDEDDGDSEDSEATVSDP